MAGKGSDGTLFKFILHLRFCRIRINNITSLLKEHSIIKSGYLNLTAYTLRALTPFQFNYTFIAVFLCDKLSNSVSSILNIHLNNNGTISFIIAEICIYPPFQFGGTRYLALTC